jgi:hypothetical protein
MNMTQKINLDLDQYQRITIIIILTSFIEKHFH